MESFFIGIALPPTLEKEIEAWRRRFRAPRTAPHITLIPPFQWTNGYHKLYAIVQGVTAKCGEFPIRGEGIGNFGKAVLFVNVEPTPELVAYQRELAQALAQFGVPVESRPYHPHITLATRLLPPRFAAFRQELADYSPSYEFFFRGPCIFQLVEEGKGKRWQMI
ncbi:MAG: 2'-5' RNA ligase family protein [Limnochordia bacterium]